MAMMDIKFGIQKRQWLLLLLALLFPLLLNALAIWLEIGTKGTFHLLIGNYQPHDPNLPFASLSEILPELLFSTLILGLLSWVTIFMSTRSFFQRQWLSIKLLESAIIIVLVAMVFAVVTGFLMPLTWLPEFNDYLLGLPASTFTAKWSGWFIFPETALVISIAMYLSRKNYLVEENN